MTFFASWKTSLAGLVGGIVMYTVQMIQSGNPWDWKAWAVGVVPVITGLLMKDYNASSTTLPNK